MSRATIATSKAELYGLLWVNDAPTFSVETIDDEWIHVWDHERREYPHPFSVTISTVGMDPDFWVLAVRVYASTARMDDKAAQDQLDLLIPAVDEKVGSNGGFGPSAWEIGWDEDLAAFVAVCLLRVGRETW